MSRFSYELGGYHLLARTRQKQPNGFSMSADIQRLEDYQSAKEELCKSVRSLGFPLPNHVIHKLLERMSFLNHWMESTPKFEKRLLNMHLMDIGIQSLDLEQSRDYLRIFSSVSEQPVWYRALSSEEKNIIKNEVLIRVMTLAQLNEEDLASFWRSIEKRLVGGLKEKLSEHSISLNHQFRQIQGHCVRDMIRCVHQTLPYDAKKIEEAILQDRVARMEITDIDSCLNPLKGEEFRLLMGEWLAWQPLGNETLPGLVNASWHVNRADKANMPTVRHLQCAKLLPECKGSLDEAYRLLKQNFRQLVQEAIFSRPDHELGRQGEIVQMPILLQSLQCSVALDYNGDSLQERAIRCAIRDFEKEIKVTGYVECRRGEQRILARPYFIYLRYPTGYDGAMGSAELTEFFDVISLSQECFGKLPYQPSQPETMRLMQLLVQRLNDVNDVYEKQRMSRDIPIFGQCMRLWDLSFGVNPLTEHHLYLASLQKVLLSITGGLCVEISGGSTHRSVLSSMYLDSLLTEYWHSGHLLDFRVAADRKIFRKHFERLYASLWYRERLNMERPGMLSFGDTRGILPGSLSRVAIRVDQRESRPRGFLRRFLNIKGLAAWREPLHWIHFLLPLDVYLTVANRYWRAIEPKERKASKALRITIQQPRLRFDRDGDESEEGSAPTSARSAK